MKTVTVPESISRQDYVELLARIGLDARDLRKLEFRMDGVYAEVMERDPETGGVRIDRQRDEVIVNKVWIPVKD